MSFTLILPTVWKEKKVRENWTERKEDLQFHSASQYETQKEGWRDEEIKEWTSEQNGGQERVERVARNWHDSKKIKCIEEWTVGEKVRGTVKTLLPHHQRPQSEWERRANLKWQKERHVVQWTHFFWNEMVLQSMRMCLSTHLYLLVCVKWKKDARCMRQRGEGRNEDRLKRTSVFVCWSVLELLGSLFWVPCVLSKPVEELSVI